MDFNRLSFIFYIDWYNAIARLDDGMRLKLYDAIMKKAFFNETPSLSEYGEIAMSFIEPQIERDFDKWLDIREKRSAAGNVHRGNQYGIQMEQTEQVITNGTSVPFDEQNGTNGTNDVYVNVNVDDNVNVEEKPDTNVSSKKKRFVKPTVEEIRAYITEKGFSFDAEAFYAYYESNGWKVGKNPMRNWKMACVTWSKNRNNNNTNNYGRETITDKIKRTVAEANLFSEKLIGSIGKEAELDYGDNEPLW